MLVTDENDVLRDEGEAYAHKLAQGGVNVITARYLGTIHDFALLNPIADAPAARGVIAQGSAFLREALNASCWRGIGGRSARRSGSVLRERLLRLLVPTSGRVRVGAVHEVHHAGHERA
jgi:alpha/beta hydrolase fold